MTRFPTLPLTRPQSRLPAIALWLAAPMALLQGINAVRTVTDPIGFARYMGAPLASAADAAWVQIYGLRAAFVALLVAALIARRDIGALKWAALAALVMPLGDAWLTHQLGAPPSTIARHGAIAAYLVVAFFAFRAAEARR